LDEKPLHIVETSETYLSSVDLFTRKPIHKYTPSVIRIVLRRGRRVKAVKIRLRLARLGNKLILDRDAIGGINIELRFLSNGGTVALGSTEPHGVQVKLLIPGRGLTPITEIKLGKNN